MLAEYARDAADWEPGRVPAEFLVAEVPGTAIGRVSIRYRLNAALLEVGGHVGYAVGPEFRGKGYGQQILRAAVGRLAAHGVDHVLVTCDASNAASSALIERCGGQLEDLREGPGGRVTRRYWITSEQVG
ncbi:GNAT family N-acetyltransferase [Brachybacterium sp. GCM10030267]|uniref:GNAT family N-acetyltransferase n=1 Tax=Brachybacterium sp. GCM10030267 TaxID=3273381 RepID=UPI0036081750